MAAVVLQGDVGNCFVAALLVYAWIVSVAITKNVAGFFG